MHDLEATPSARKAELLEAAYAYALEHGLGELSLRPLAAAIGSSPRVLLYLFGSKHGLVRALLGRARGAELTLLSALERRSGTEVADDDRLHEAALRVWDWLADPAHRALLTLWVEAYGRSLVDRDGPWAGFAEATVSDWLAVLAEAQPPEHRDDDDAVAARTAVLAIVRGALLDLLATGDAERVSAAVTRQLASNA